MWLYRRIDCQLLLFLFCIIQIYRCSRLDTEDIINPAGLSSLKWGFHPRELESTLASNITKPHYRSRRFVNLGSPEKTSTRPYEACIAPGNKDGHCKHLRDCVLEEFRGNFSRFVDYMCILEHAYIGVCCPDRAVVGSANSESPESLAGVLPAIANPDDYDTMWEINDTYNETMEHNSTPVHRNSTTEEETRKPRGPRGCGTSTKSKTRVVGGRPADPREWPWMVALLRRDTIHYCGGVLITDRHVLTAAHCVQTYKPRDITIRLGEYDFERPDETRSLDFKAIEIRIHRDFDPSTYENDIAIIKIHRPTTFNTYIWPICLPPIDQKFENKNAVVTGWGTQYYGGPASAVLMEVTVPIWPQEKCVRSFTQRIPGTVMCAGAYEGGRDACQGDSGGPLLHQLGNGRWVNVGIVSWGIRCGEPGHPGIYTRVNSYLDWIFANAVF